MESYFCEAVLCISAGCVLVGGMIAFIAFGIWKIESMKDVPAPPQKIERRKDIFWKSHKETVENSDEACFKTVSFITPLFIAQSNHWQVFFPVIFIKVSSLSRQVSCFMIMSHNKGIVTNSLLCFLP